MLVEGGLVVFSRLDLPLRVDLGVGKRSLATCVFMAAASTTQFISGSFFVRHEG